MKEERREQEHQDYSSMGARVVAIVRGIPSKPTCLQTTHHIRYCSHRLICHACVSKFPKLRCSSYFTGKFLRNLDEYEHEQVRVSYSVNVNFVVKYGIDPLPRLVKRVLAPANQRLTTGTSLILHRRQSRGIQRRFYGQKPLDQVPRLRAHGKLFRVSGRSL